MKTGWKDATHCYK